MIRFTENFRPIKLDDIIGQDDIVKSLKKMIEDNNIPHLLFCGMPGVGKTTAAFAFAKEIKYKIYEFNASDERGIDFIRQKIKEISRFNVKKIIILDEADQLTNAAQQSLRRIIEGPTSSRKTVFIFCVNNINKIIPAIKSRCAIFSFKPLSNESLLLIINNVLSKMNISPKNEGQINTLINIVNKSKGDARKALNLLSLVIENNSIIENWNQSYNKMKVIFDLTVQGEFDQVYDLIETYYIEKSKNIEEIFEEIFETIKDYNFDTQTKSLLYYELGKIESTLPFAIEPFVQLVRFFAYLHIIKFLPKQCPKVIRDE